MEIKPFFTSAQSDYFACLFYKRQLLFFRNVYDIDSSSYFDFYMKLSAHLISLKNFKDYIKEKSLYFKDKEELISLKKELFPLLECAEYLRNKISGHVDNAFVEQSVTWTPQMLSKVQTTVSVEKAEQYRTELFIKSLIESGINSYSVDYGNKGYYLGEIDLLYPPDFKRLMLFVEQVNEKSIKLLELLIPSIEMQVHFFEGLDEQLSALSYAASMDFGTKK